MRSHSPTNLGAEWFLHVNAATLRRNAQAPAGAFRSVADWARSQCDFSPDPTQETILDSSAPRLLLCCSRQWGKSTITALKAVHFALHNPGSLILIASRTIPQSAEWLRKANSFLRHLSVLVRTDGIHRHSLVLPNLSRIVCLSDVPDNVVGISGPGLIVIDEAARVSENLIVALIPMLAASNGHLWVLSTPYKQTGFFYEAWHRNSDLWTRFLVTAENCARISPDFLAEARIHIGDTQFRREFLCEFKAGDDQIFTRELIDRAFRPGKLFNGGKPLCNG
jgi:hypothetical protein